MEPVEYLVYISIEVYLLHNQLALATGLAQLWTNQNAGIPPGALVIQLQNQVQYICSGGLENKERID